MIIRNKIFYHVNKFLDWEEGFEFLVGEEPSPQYMSLMSREALYDTNDGSSEQYPLTYVAAGFQYHKETGSAPPQFPQNIDLKKGKIFSATLNGFKDFVLITRELIFEEVRKEKFPDKPSRRNAFHIIKDDKAAVAFWLPKIASPEHKLYKLEVTGKAHIGNVDYLGNDSVSPMMTRWNAYQYWLGAEKDVESNEIMFEGAVKVLGVKQIGG